MITNYRPPRLIIEQLLEVTPNPTSPRLNPVVIGPSYHVENFDVEAQQGVTFASAGVNLPYETKDANGNFVAIPSNYVVDAASVDVTMVGGDAELLAVSAGASSEYIKLRDESLSNSAVLKLYGATDAESDYNLAVRDGYSTASLLPGLAGRGIQVGDIVECTANSVTKRRTVTELIGADIAMSYGTNGDKDNTTPDADTYNIDATTASSPITATTTIPGGPSITTTVTAHGFHGLAGAQSSLEYKDVFTLVCVTAGAPGVARMAVSSASGNFSNPSILSTGTGLSYSFDDFDTSYRGLAGMVVTFTTAQNLAVDDTITITVKGDYVVPSLGTRASGGAAAKTVEIISGLTYTGTKDTTYLVEVIQSVQVNKLMKLSASGGWTGASAGVVINQSKVNTITVPGTGYTGASAVATTGGSGSGMTVDTTDTAGAITAVTINNAGVGYKTGDTIVITGGSNTAAFTLIKRRYTVLAIPTSPLGTSNDRIVEPIDSVDSNFSDIANTDRLYLETTGVLTATSTAVEVPGDAANAVGFGDGINESISHKVRVSDTEGVDGEYEVLVTDGVLMNLGTKGLKFSMLYDADVTLTQGGLAVGELFFVYAVAAAQSTDEFDKVRLNGPAVDTLTFTPTDKIACSFRIGDITHTLGITDSPGNLATYTVNANPNGVDLEANLYYYVAERDSGQEWIPFVNSVGKVYASFRALIPPATNEGVIEITSSNLVSSLGVVDLNNTLAYGANACLAASGGSNIYALRVASDDAAGFTAAFSRIEKSDKYYALAILSDKAEVRLAAKTHVEAMSTPDVQNFRRAYVATESPGEYAIISTRPNGTAVKATIADLNGAYTLVTCTASDVSFVSAGVAPGDTFRLVATDEDYEVDYVIDANELVLKTGPNSGNGVGATFQIIRPDTPDTQALFVQDASIALASRRVSNIWSDRPANASVQIPVMYLAAEMAGARCALLPQQGLTRTTVTAVTDAPSMYTQYSTALLNTIAANGVWIVTQEAEDGPVFVRHQLTTDVNNGALYYEDNIGVNLDEISFAIKDALAGFIGRRTISKTTLTDIKVAVQQVLDDRTVVDNATLADIGPQINRWDNLVIEVDAVLKDRINVSVDVYMGLPLNELKVTLNAFADVPTITA